jgi:hypothetical protein
MYAIVPASPHARLHACPPAFLPASRAHTWPHIPGMCAYETSFSEKLGGEKFKVIRGHSRSTSTSKRPLE